MAKFLMTELVDNAEVITARLGGTPAAGNPNGYTDKEVGKFVKLSAESRFVLCAAGDPIQGRISSVETAPLDGISVGGVMPEGFMQVTFDGLEATPGTGVVAIDDCVVCGTVVAVGTGLTVPAKVVKATNQPGTVVVSTLAGADTAAAIQTVVNAALAKVADAEGNAKFPWRVVSLGSAGTGAVGTTGVIQLVG